MLEDAVKGLMSVIRFVLATILWSIALFELGRAVLLVATLGRFPRGPDVHRHEDTISWVGLIFLVLVWSVVVIYNRFIVGAV